MPFLIQDLPAEDRPRERLVKHGPRVLSVTELIAVLLSTGTSGTPVMHVAQDLLKKYSNIVALSQASVKELSTQSGIGLAKACVLLAAFELVRRAEATAVRPRFAHSPEEAARIAREYLSEPLKEQCIVLCLDIRQKIVHAETVSTGTLTASLVHPREVFSVVIKHHAASFMLAHNHPSGDATPSSEDILLTERMKTAGDIFGVPLLDHIIITLKSYYSFCETKLL